MARNASSKKAKKVEPEYTLGYDADGNVVLVPVTPDTAPARSPFSRISEGAMEGYGYQPLGMSEKDIAEYPNAARYLNPIAKALDAVRRAPGAVAGGLAGTAGAGAELWTGDRGVANEAERAVRSALEYGGNQSMATMGGPRPGPNQAAVNGKLYPPERVEPRQLGFTEKPIVDIRRELPPGVIRAGSAEGLPRLTYEEPLSRYGLSSEQGQRVGPRRPSEAFRPVIDEMYTVPEQLNRTPETTTPSSVARLGDESPLQAERQGVLDNAARTREAEFQANQRAAAENEGMARPLTQSDRDFAQFQRELDAANRGESVPFTPPAIGGAPRSPLLDMPAPGVRRRLPPPPAEPTPPRFDFGGPQPASGSFSPIVRAEALVPEPVNLDAMLGRPPTVQANVQNAIDIAKQRSDTMRRNSADATGQQAAIDAAAQRVAVERAASPNALIDQAIADVTGQAPAGAAPIPRQTFGLRQRAPVEGVEAAPAAPKQAAPSLSAADIDLLRKNGFDELAAQVEAVQAQQAASAAPAAAGPASGPWGAIPQPSKGLPPGSTYTPSMAAAPATPAASVSGLPTPKSWTLTDTALGAGSLGILGAVADREERRQKKALEAAQSRQRIDDMDEAAFRAARSQAPPSFPIDEVQSQYVIQNERRDSPDTMDYLRGKMLPAQSQRPEYMSGNAPAQQRSAPAAPAGGGSFLDKIFSGKDYQSSGGLLQQKQDGNRVLNWGDSDNAADFFRADAMKRRLEDQQQQFTGRSGSDIDYENRMAGEGKARGGAAEQRPSKEAMLHKSLEIIHHMIKNR
jgi:hypothetical protein